MTRLGHTQDPKDPCIAIVGRRTPDHSDLSHRSSFDPTMTLIRDAFRITKKPFLIRPLRHLTRYNIYTRTPASSPLLISQLLLIAHPTSGSRSPAACLGSLCLASCHGLRWCFE